MVVEALNKVILNLHSLFGHRHSWSKPKLFSCYLLLSWLYAGCSQVIIPLPFYFVPISIQPVPLLLATYFFGWHAVNAYWIYLFQGALGAPFFSRFGGGLIHLIGPTGGYLFGFGLAMIFVAIMRKKIGSSILSNFFIILVAETIYFSCGLFQLSWFVPKEMILSAGLYPFIFCDFVLKIALILLVIQQARRFSS